MENQLLVGRRAWLSSFCLRTALIFSLALLAGNAMASSKTPGKVIAGWVEKVTVVSADVVTKAKLDTGAKTSSIYAINVENFERDGERWTRFDLVVNDSEDAEKVVSLERKRVRKVRIKGEGESYDRRSVVTLPICFDGRSYEVEFTLANRKNYIYPVLLGREFLTDRVVVDSGETFLTKSACP